MDRRISLKEYFDCLQREYIVALIRAQIYLFAKDKDYYNNRELPMKKKTIIEISSRNNFKNIFNDSFIFLKYKSEICNEWGLPNFVYRNKLDRSQRRPKDIINFFQKGSKVFVKMPDETIKEGTIIYTYYLDKNAVEVEVEGKNIEFPYEKVARILQLEI